MFNRCRSIPSSTCRSIDPSTENPFFMFWANVPPWIEGDRGGCVYATWGAEWVATWIIEQIWSTSRKLAKQRESAVLPHREQTLRSECRTKYAAQQVRCEISEFTFSVEIFFFVVELLFLSGMSSKNNRNRHKVNSIGVRDTILSVSLFLACIHAPIGTISLRLLHPADSKMAHISSE